MGEETVMDHRLKMLGKQLDRLLKLPLTISIIETSYGRSIASTAYWATATSGRTSWFVVRILCGSPNLICAARRAAIFMFS